MTNATEQLGNAATTWWQAVLAGFSRTEVPSFPPALLLGILAAAIVLSIPRVTWRWFGLYVTFVHELGHAFAALMTGRVVHGLKIGLDHSGQLVSSGRRGFSATPDRGQLRRAGRRTGDGRDFPPAGYAGGRPVPGRLGGCVGARRRRPGRGLADLAAVRRGAEGPGGQRAVAGPALA